MLHSQEKISRKPGFSGKVMEKLVLNPGQQEEEELDGQRGRTSLSPKEELMCERGQAWKMSGHWGK